MKNLMYYFFLLLLVAACNDDTVNDKPDNEIDPEQEITETEYKIEKLTGQVQKGPYNNGTTISIYELTGELAQTGRVFKSEINNNKGEFEISNITLESPYVIVEANGFYFNECTGENSEAQLTLSVIADIKDRATLNINLLSHLEKDRVMKLVDEGSSFKEAKLQAKNEILSVYDMDENSDTIASEHLDINKDGDSNARLLAISAIMQVGNTTSDLSKLIADLKTDLYDNGALDEDSIGNVLLTQATLVNEEKIRQNLENKYSAENMEAAVPEFGKFVDVFLEKSTFKVNSLVSYPDSTFYGKNILDKEVDTVYYGEYYALAADLHPDIKCKIVIQGKGLVLHIGLENPTNIVRSGNTGNINFESLPGVEYINTEIHFESFAADEFGVSRFTIEYYEGADELVKTGSKELVVVQRNYTPYYTIPEVGMYGDNIFAMEGDTLTFQPDTKYSFEFETHKELFIQSLIRIRDIDTSKVIVNEADLLNCSVERFENEIIISVNDISPANRYSASVVFKGHGKAEISGGLSILMNTERIRLKDFIRQPIEW